MRAETDVMMLSAASRELHAHLAAVTLSASGKFRSDGMDKALSKFLDAYPRYTKNALSEAHLPIIGGSPRNCFWQLFVD